MRTSSFAATVSSLIGLLAACLAGSAGASLFKCVEDGNRVVYQDSACPPGKELRNFDTDPAEVSVIPHQEFTEGKSAPAPANPGKASAAPTKSGKAGSAIGGDSAQRKFIAAGMTEAEVIARIGSPDITSGEKGRKSARWSYLPTAGDPQTITSIDFSFGKVVAIDRKIVH
jgi:Domain of unknown function (DUF4124)